MRKDLLHILQHSLGLDQYGQGRQYRNYYVAGGDAIGRCQELVAMGYMREHKMAPELTGGAPCFVVTRLGIEAVATHSPAPPPEPKLTRAQRRYRDYCHSEDSDGFAWFLGIDVPDVESRYSWNGRKYTYEYRYRRTQRRYWDLDVIEGDWKPTKKEAKASYKEALRQRREREKQAAPEAA